MGDLVNPYANPYLPAFINQRPRMNEPLTPASTMPNFTQIHSVKGFEGARAYNLSQGSSEILAESDPNVARVYVVAVDGTGQRFVEGFNLVHIEEPKPVTMDDLNAKMSELLDRMNKLEDKQNGKSNNNLSDKGQRKSNNIATGADCRSDTVSAVGSSEYAGK